MRLPCLTKSILRKFVRFLARTDLYTWRHDTWATKPTLRMTSRRTWCMQASISEVKDFLEAASCKYDDPSLPLEKRGIRISLEGIATNAPGAAPARIDPFAADVPVPVASMPVASSDLAQFKKKCSCTNGAGFPPAGVATETVAPQQKAGRRPAPRFFHAATRLLNLPYPFGIPSRPHFLSTAATVAGSKATGWR